jgi:serine/threonine-protein kinase
MPELVAGRFRVQRSLASGGMGQVYEALDTFEGERRVALKVQRDNDPDTARRFAREAEILTNLRHPVAVGCR